MVKSVVTAASIATLVLSFQAHADAAKHWNRSQVSSVHPGIVVAERGTLVDRDRAAASVRAATGGRVLGVRSGTAHGKAVYQVKVLLQGGHVRIFRVDAQTGQLLD